MAKNLTPGRLVEGPRPRRGHPGRLAPVAGGRPGREDDRPAPQRREERGHRMGAILEPGFGAIRMKEPRVGRLPRTAGLSFYVRKRMPR